MAPVPHRGGAGGGRRSTVHVPGCNGRVAVLDSGVDVNSSELDASFGTNCSDSTNPLDVVGHGTAVAGLIGARNNGGAVLGVALARGSGR